MTSADCRQYAVVDSMSVLERHVRELEQLLLIRNTGIADIVKAGTHQPNHWTSEALWGDSDEVGTKSVRCAQLHWKLSELRGRCLLRLNMQSLRRVAVSRLKHWIL